MTQTSIRNRNRTDEAERASIRALKNWLLAAPCENALEDQIVRLRLASAIAALTTQHSAFHAGKRPGPQSSR